VSLALLLACAEDPLPAPVDQEPAGVRDLLGLPDHLEVPAIPSYNPLTRSKIDLGRRLFYDQRLSGNETQSCSDCHDQALAFADGKTTPSGSTGDVLFRNSPGLANVAYYTTLTWASDVLLELEDQILVPILNDHPTELGVTDANQVEVLQRFADDPAYAAQFAAAFPDQDGRVTLDTIAYALASFVRTMISADSAYDRYLAGDDGALTDEQKRGMALFHGETFECFHCHGGTNATISYRDWRTTSDTIQFPFFNTGLYNVDGEGSYPAYDQGLFDLTFDPDHRGLFRPQSLRNVAVTAPFEHDGSVATLREVVENYAAGGRVITEGDYAGDGRTSPLKSGLVRGFEASDEEIDAVVAFLESLTDEEFLANPAFGPPPDEG
jgi:cytochrome c peroxidase